MYGMENDKFGIKLVFPLYFQVSPPNSAPSDLEIMWYMVNFRAVVLYEDL